MRLFSEFLGEDAGEKFRAMSDDQFADWKKANPGAAAKADQLRGGKSKSSSVNDPLKDKYGSRVKEPASNKEDISKGADPLKDKYGSRVKEPKIVSVDPKARDKAVSKGSAIVKAKQDQRKQQAQEKSALVKQQSQEKRIEQKKDQQEKQNLRKQQSQEKQELAKRAQAEKAQQAKEKSKAPKQQPGGALVKHMQNKAKAKPTTTNKMPNLGIKKGIKKGISTVGKVAKGVYNAAKSVDTNSAVGIGSAPGDQKGLVSRTSNL